MLRSLVGSGDVYKRQVNMRVILLSLHTYSDLFGVLPAPTAVDEQMKPIHSWRTAILPYMELKDFYELVDPLNTPWNEGQNLHLQETKMPHYFSPRSETTSEWCTCYALVVGKETVFENHPHFTIESTGGPRLPKKRTGLLIELTKSDIAWMEPRDVTIDEAIAIIQNSKLRGGTLVGFSDRHVEAIPPTTSEDEIRRLFSTIE